ncbi:hypothetical protein Tco_1224279 [Tanacetum coccineum]
MRRLGQSINDDPNRVMSTAGSSLNARVDHHAQSSNSSWFHPLLPTQCISYYVRFTWVVANLAIMIAKKLYPSSQTYILLGFKDFKVILRVNTAQNEENILSTYYCLCSVSAASSRVNAAGLNC